MRQRVLSRLPILDFHKSTLGEWYAGLGQVWEKNKDFGQLQGAHRELHESAERLIKAALENEPLEEIMGLIESFSVQANLVAQSLHEIELQGLIKHYRL